MKTFNEEKILTRFSPKVKDAIDLAICFPNTYSIGMASLGYQTAWNLFNQSENIKAVRWFTDIKEHTRKKPRFIGFSFSWELDYKNILNILEKNKIPIYKKDRNENDPIVFAGGQVINANPEPFCDFFDFFLMGDLEEIANDFVCRGVLQYAPTKNKTLQQLSEIPGVYVPSVVRAPHWGAPTKGNLAHSSILTPNTIWPNTFLMEVVRSCPEMCRFCLASYGSLPFRKENIESLKEKINFGLRHTNKIGLMGPSVTQHPEIEKLINFLLTKKDINVQIASVRADTISKSLSDGLFKLGAKSVTMAVETGSEKLRDKINKKVSNETIKKSIDTIYNSGFNSVKLYGMVGLPFEEDGDLKETIDFLKEIKQKHKTKKLVFSCSIFVPKLKTPFKKYGMDKNGEKKLKFYSRELHKIGIDFRPESYKWSLIQGLISRGDKSMGKVLEKAYRYGSTLGAFNRAIKEEKIDFEELVFKGKDH